MLLELIHEEIEFKVKAGEPSGLAAYPARFPEIAADPHALGELVAAESELRLAGDGRGARSRPPRWRRPRQCRGRRPASADTSCGT